MEFTGSGKETGKLFYEDSYLREDFERLKRLFAKLSAAEKR